MDAYIPQGVATHLSVNGLIGITWAGAALGVIFASIRIAIRLRRMKRLLADDYFVLLALAFLITNAILQTLQAPSLYYLILDITGPDIVDQGVKYTHYEFVIIGLFWTVLWCIKGSFLALFWAITDGLPHYRRVWWIITVFTVLAYMACWLVSAFNCHPPSNYFKFGACSKPIDKKTSIISICYSTAVDIITDLMIMCLPLRILWNTRINSHQKLGLGVVFCLGFIIIAAAIIRAVEIAGKSYSDQAALAVWGITESSISVIVGCLPPFKSFISSSTSTKNSTYRYRSSAYTPNFDSSMISTKNRRRSLSRISSSEAPIPLHDRNNYQEIEYDLQGKHKVHIAGGVDVNVRSIPSADTSSASMLEDENGYGEIRMVKEFSVVSR